MGIFRTRLLVLLQAAAGLLCALTACTGPPPEPPPTPEERGAPEPGHYPSAAPITTPYPAGEIDALWGSDYANQFQNSRIAVAGPQSADLAWQSINSGNFSRTGVIDEQGRLYVIAGRILIAHSPQGAELWRAVLDSGGSGVHGELALREGGGVYLADNDGNVYAYAASGLQLWKYAGGNDANFSPKLTAGTDGNVYLTSYRHFIALSAEGSELWRFKAADELGIPVAAQGGGAFAVSNDGLSSASSIIYFRDGGMEWSTPATNLFYGVTEGDGLVHALSSDSGLMSFDIADGRLVRQSAPFHIYPSPRPIMRAPDGSLYLLTAAPSIVAFNSDGSLRSEAALDIFIDSYASMRPDGSIVLSITEYNTGSGPPVDYAACFSRGGALLWKAALPMREMSTRPAPDGSVYAIGRTRLARFSSAGAILWEQLQLVERMERPLIDEVGNIYVRGGGALTSFTPAGVQRWRQPLIERSGSISLGSGGRIYMQTGNILDSYNSTNGARQWSRELEVPLDDGRHGTVIVGNDGSLLSIVEGIGIYSLSPDGSVRWLYISDATLFGRPAIDEKGSIHVFKRRDQYVSLLALDRNGLELWEKPADATAQLLMLDGAGRIYVIGNSNLISAFDSSGTPLWSVNTGNGLLRQIAMGLEGPLVFSAGDTDRAIRSYDSEGSLLWKHDLPLDPSAQPAVDSDGRIYAATNDGFVLCLSPDGDELWRRELPGSLFSARPLLSLSPDGSLAVANSNELLVLREGAP